MKGKKEYYQNPEFSNYTRALHSHPLLKVKNIFYRPYLLKISFLAIYLHLDRGLDGK